MSNPVPIFGTQDLHDDDAKVIDDYLIETDAPPNMDAAKQPIEQDIHTPIAVTSRLEPCGELVLTPTMDPVQIFWPDKNRKHCYIRVYSPTTVATDGIRFGENRPKSMTGARLLHSNAPTIDDYTGSMWVYPQAVTGVANSANVNVEYWAVTW